MHETNTTFSINQESWFTKAKNFTFAICFPYTEGAVKYRDETKSYFKLSGLSLLTVGFYPIVFISKFFYSSYEIATGTYSKLTEQAGNAPQSQDKGFLERFKDFWKATIFDHTPESAEYFASYNCGIRKGLHRFLCFLMSPINFVVMLISAPYELVMGALSKEHEPYTTTQSASVDSAAKKEVAKEVAKDVAKLHDSSVNSNAPDFSIDSAVSSCDLAKPKLNVQEYP